MLRTGYILIVLSLLIVQVASAQTVRPRATNYWMPSDVQPVGGGEAAKSTKYILDDTVGEANIGPSRSDTFDLNAGYRQTVAPAYIAMNCDDVANLGTITLTGMADGSATCTVTTDADAGYALTWRSGTNNSNGLVGHWKLDETTGSTAYDSSGYGSNGTFEDDTAVSTVVPSNYFSTRSLEFDGAADYVSIEDSAHLDFSTALTVSAWVKASETGRFHGIVGKAGNIWSDVSFATRIINTNQYSFVTTSDGTTVDEFNAPAIVDTNWHHLAFRFDGSTKKIFVDGVEQASKAWAGPLYQNNQPITIGAYALATGLNYTMEGNLDDVRLFNRPLSTAEIRDLASKAPPGSLVMSGSQTTHIAPINMPFTGGLVGHWKMDEPVAGTVADSSGYGNDGTPSGTTISADIPTGANHVTTRSLNFDGTDDYVSMTEPPPSSLNINKGSVFAWIKTAAAGSSHRGIVVKQSAYGMFLLDDIFVIYDWSAASNRSTGIDVSDGEWHLVGFTFDSGVSNGTKLYIDGVEQLTTTMTVSSQGGGVVLGAGDNAGSIQRFNGLIDDARIYDRVLSAAEVAALYSIPQSWGVANNDARWGARLSSASDDTDAKWGTDSSSEKWLNVGEGSYPLVTRSSRTDEDGSTEIINFRAEIGSTAVVPAGVYTSNVVFTASAL